MNKNNIALIGFMASGKTLASRQLGQILDKEVISTDALIEKKENRSIMQIFDESGEDYFRQVEKEVLKKVLSKDNIIVDGGGGIILDQENRNLLKEHCCVIYLSSSPEIVLERIKTQTHRPLLKVEDPLAKIKELLLSRENFYREADYEVNTDHKTVDEMCEDIMKVMG